MTAEQSIYGALLAIALVLAGKTPGKALQGCVVAALAVSVSWMLVIWSYQASVSPAQLIADHVGPKISPSTIWLFQDALLSVGLWARYERRPDPVLLTVGLIFAAQVFFHIFREGIGGLYMPALNSLFLAQLVVVGFQGGQHVGQHIGDWFRLVRRGGLGASLRRAGPALPIEASHSSDRFRWSAGRDSHANPDRADVRHGRG